MDRHRTDKPEEVRTGAHDPADAGLPAESPADGRDWGDDWVHELIAMTRPGVEIEFPVRRIDEREVPFVYDDFR